MIDDESPRDATARVATDRVRSGRSRATSATPRRGGHRRSHQGRLSLHHRMDRHPDPPTRARPAAPRGRRTPHAGRTDGTAGRSDDAGVSSFGMEARVATWWSRALRASRAHGDADGDGHGQRRATAISARSSRRSAPERLRYWRRHREQRRAAAQSRWSTKLITASAKMPADDDR